MRVGFGKGIFDGSFQVRFQSVHDKVSWWFVHELRIDDFATWWFLGQMGFVSVVCGYMGGFMARWVWFHS